LKRNLEKTFWSTKKKTVLSLDCDVSNISEFHYFTQYKKGTKTHGLKHKRIKKQKKN
jgi:hypothetical protein